MQFKNGDPRRPILVGLIESRALGQPTSPRAEVTVDGERIRLRAADELVLDCGEAKVTLTRAGKIILEGTYVSSRSTGVNRVKGAMVDLN